MKQNYKKIGIAIAIIILVLIISTYIANRVIEGKVTTAIENLPSSVSVDYSEVEVSVWTAKMTLKDPVIKITGQTTGKNILEATLKAIEIDDISYWNLLVNDKISIEEFNIIKPILKYLHNPHVKKDDYQSGFLDNIKRIIDIEKLSIKDADILISDYDTDSLLLSIPKLNVGISDLKINSKSSKSNKKIRYDDLNVQARNVKWASNTYDDIYANTIYLTNSELKVEDFQYKTKYSRSEYSALLPKERDHFDLNVEEIMLSDLDYGFDSNKKFYLTSNMVQLISPTSEIYRDKLVADDLTKKALYGKMLRELDLNLGLKSIEITDGSISYLEKVNAENQAGRLDFTNMNATITNLGNTFGEEETSIKVNSTFMKNSPLEVHWNFKVADSTDQFTFKADIGLLNATVMDQFTQPNLNVDLNGELNQTYFTISGDPNRSRIDLKVKYEDFEISILKKEGKEKNKFLSTLVNLFVSKDSEDDQKSYRYGQSENVERDATKSVFNFIWLNIKDGLLSAMAGNGEKAD